MFETLLITHLIVVLIAFLIIGGVRFLDVATKDPYRTRRLHGSAGCIFLGLALVVIFSCIFLAAKHLAVGQQMSSYQVWIVASSPNPVKAMGTDVSSAVPSCGSQQPSLFFYSQEDAQSYRDQLAWQLRDSFQVYSAIMKVEK